MSPPVFPSTTSGSCTSRREGADDAGVHVTINSDDPHFFSTTLCRESGIAAALMDLDEAGIAQLGRNALGASFLPEGRKATLVAEIDAYLAAFLEAASADD